MTGRTIAKALKKLHGKEPSRTPGKDKGANCKASARSKYMCKRNRSYKHRDYTLWCALKHGGVKGPVTSEG